MKDEIMLAIFVFIAVICCFGFACCAGDSKPSKETRLSVLELKVQIVLEEIKNIKQGLK